MYLFETNGSSTKTGARQPEKPSRRLSATSLISW